MVSVMKVHAVRYYAPVMQTFCCKKRRSGVKLYWAHRDDAFQAAGDRLETASSTEKDANSDIF